MDEAYRFCPNCGAQLLTSVSGPGVPPVEPGIPGPQAERKPSGARVAAVIAIIVLLVAVSVLVLFPSVSPPRTSTLNTQPPCPTSSSSSTFVSAPIPNYDVQEVMVFSQSYQQLEVNVTALAQCDQNGYGPAYLLNGLTNTGYWYQVGINWDWPVESGGYSPGFGFVSEAWAPGGLTRSPAPIAFSGTVNVGDTIELSLSFSGGQVVASALDVNTGASGSTGYAARFADTFIGSEAQQSQARFSFATQGYFTGLMTEWYHVSSSDSGIGQSVTYSENATAITSATLGVGEWNFTTAQPSSVFSVVANNGNPVDFSAQPDQLQQFSLAGYTLSADAYEFVTGP